MYLCYQHGCVDVQYICYTYVQYKSWLEPWSCCVVEPPVVHIESRQVPAMWGPQTIVNLL
jgi:hypothetical protein